MNQTELIAALRTQIETAKSFYAQGMMKLSQGNAELIKATHYLRLLEEEQPKREAPTLSPDAKTDFRVFVDEASQQIQTMLDETPAAEDRGGSIKARALAKLRQAREEETNQAQPAPTPPPAIEIVRDEAAPEKHEEEGEPELIINDEWRAILDDLNGESSDARFITGNAGTGKTTLMRHFAAHANRNIVIVAPTGVAALRAGGMTIHSFFGLPIGVVEPESLNNLTDKKVSRIRHLQVLIIDEASMIRADVMDGIVSRLQQYGPNPRLPFGGVRIVMFGDPFQLPPVVVNAANKKWLAAEYGDEMPFFFHSNALRGKITPTELTTTFRQKDPLFVDALNALRRGKLSPAQMALLNAQVNPSFVPSNDEPWVSLTTTNEAADRANQAMLAALKTPEKIFKAIVEGEFKGDKMPTDEYLKLKEGAPVMFIRNDVEHRWVNGTLGRVVQIDPLKVECPSGIWRVDPEEWENIEYLYNEDEHRIKKHVIGTFNQLPLRVAAAITIHKSQGLTLPRAIIDLGNRVFAPGQTYVAVSRCTSLPGMILRRPIRTDDLIVSEQVVRFLSGQPIAQPQKPRQTTLFDIPPDEYDDAPGDPLTGPGNVVRDLEGEL